MHEKDFPTLPSGRRGVHRAVAPTGYEAIQVIDSTGDEFAQLSIRAGAFDPLLVLALRTILEERDPQPDEAFLLALLDAAMPGDRRKRRGRKRI